MCRVPLGPGQGGGMGAHAQLGLGAMAVPPPHHAPASRAPHPIRPMHHPQQHHSMPPVSTCPTYILGTSVNYVIRLGGEKVDRNLAEAGLGKYVVIFLRKKL